MSTRRNKSQPPASSEWAVQMQEALRALPSGLDEQRAYIESAIQRFLPRTHGHVKVWKKIGPAVLAQPKRSLAAWLDHKPAVQVLEAAGFVVPTSKLLASDGDFKPDPHGLGLSRDEKAQALFARSTALWGPQALQRAALACAELQMQTQTKCAPEREPLRDAALKAARDHLTAPSGAKRVAAAAAVEACWIWYESKHGKRPDSAAARACWVEFGAPWFAAALAGDAMALNEYDGQPPRVASPSWGYRNATDLGRAADSAAHWAGSARTLAAMHDVLLAWVLDDAAPAPELI